MGWHAVDTSVHTQDRALRTVRIASGGRQHITHKHVTLTEQHKCPPPPSHSHTRARTNWDNTRHSWVEEMQQAQQGGDGHTFIGQVPVGDAIDKGCVQRREAREGAQAVANVQHNRHQSILQQ